MPAASISRSRAVGSQQFAAISLKLVREPSASLRFMHAQPGVWWASSIHPE
jgi:hypothetical protein